MSEILERRSPNLGGGTGWGLTGCDLGLDLLAAEHVVAHLQRVEADAGGPRLVELLDARIVQTYVFDLALLLHRLQHPKLRRQAVSCG